MGLSGRMLSSRMADLPEETAYSEAERLYRLGVPFINFAWGDPDQPTPEPVKNATYAALLNEATKYADSLGIGDLRKAIAQHVSHTRHTETAPDQVMVLPGANPAIFMSLMVIADEGNEVIFPCPGYPLYIQAIAAARCIPVPMPLRPELDYAFDPGELSRLITPRTRAIIINSPHNPTGSVLEYEHLATLACLAQEHDLWLLTDEVYRDLYFREPPHSVLECPESAGRTLLIDSFSKTFAMTGWRLGYVVGPDYVIKRLGTVFSWLDFSVNTFVQYGGIEALRHYDAVASAMREEYRKRHDVVVSMLDEIPGVRCPEPAGAFYVFPEISGLCARLGLRGAREFQSLVLDRCRVALIARDWFGPKNPGEQGEYVRLSYTLPHDEMTGGLRRIASLAGIRL